MEIQINNNKRKRKTKNKIYLSYGTFIHHRCCFRFSHICFEYVRCCFPFVEKWLYFFPFSVSCMFFPLPYLDQDVLNGGFLFVVVFETTNDLASKHWKLQVNVANDTWNKKIVFVIRMKTTLLCWNASIYTGIISFIMIDCRICIKHIVLDPECNGNMPKGAENIMIIVSSW